MCYLLSMSMIIISVIMINMKKTIRFIYDLSLSVYWFYRFESLCKSIISLCFYSLSLIILICVTSVLLSPYVIHLVSSTLVIWDSFIVPHQYRIRVIHLRHCNGIALTPHEPLIACNKFWHFVWLPCLCVIDPILFFYCFASFPSLSKCLRTQSC